MRRGLGERELNRRITDARQILADGKSSAFDRFAKCMLVVQTAEELDQCLLAETWLDAAVATKGVGNHDDDVKQEREKLGVPLTDRMFLTL